MGGGKYQVRRAWLLGTLGKCQAPAEQRARSVEGRKAGRKGREHHCAGRRDGHTSDPLGRVKEESPEAAVGTERKCMQVCAGAPSGGMGWPLEQEQGEPPAGHGPGRERQEPGEAVLLL